MVCSWCVCLSRFCRHADENKRQKVALILDKLITMTIDEVEVSVYYPGSYIFSLSIHLVFCFVYVSFLYNFMFLRDMCML